MGTKDQVIHHMMWGYYDHVRENGWSVPDAEPTVSDLRQYRWVMDRVVAYTQEGSKKQDIDKWLST
jgi:hypothetical protein